ncbi:GNAT family N-acetyltransferase [Kribbella soli]|uniref:GNAT family N-acetyltransferase n=1 Tax=Kribbella soli TaxID=1124743 RepID=A0A4R0HC47_9ACTN|nr:GNAT family N-acetyltransferase [Kribbella soli]TCC06302.1 GNAT family N-acetyltransferase [Kribbella soli]
MTIEVHPVDTSRWADLEQLFGGSGGYDGCWCMFWRLPNKELNANGPEDNRQALHDLVHTDAQVGLIAYADGTPAGWCSTGPRPGYARIERTKALRPDDPADPQVWAVPCFFVSKEHRGQGVARALLEAAVDRAADAGATMLEGYPVANPKGAGAALSTGTVDLFSAAGFTVGGDQPASGRRVVTRRAL